MKNVLLKDICIPGGIQTGPFGSQLHQSDYRLAGIPVIMPVNLIDGHVSESNIARIPNERAVRLSKYRVSEGDIVYSRRGDVGRCSRIGAKESGWLCGTGCLKISPDNKQVDANYLFYLLNLPSVIGWVKSNAKGTTMPNLNTEILSSIPLVIEPNLNWQKKAADILYAYDAFIENNRKQIKLLEEAAQRLYKEWFIDLRFPGYESTPINPETGLPEGWAIVKIKDLCLRIQSGSTPKRNNLNYWSSNDVKWFKTAELHDCWLIDSEEHISKEALGEASVKVFPANAILMAIYASPTLGRLGLLSECATFNQAALGFVVNESAVSKEWLFQKFYELRSEFNMIARGAGQQNISGEIVKEYEVLIPAKNLVDRYTIYAKPIFDSILKLQQQNTFLIEARDRLLPKLMSGEIEV